MCCLPFGRCWICCCENGDVVEYQRGEGVRVASAAADGRMREKHGDRVRTRERSRTGQNRGGEIERRERHRSRGGEGRGTERQGGGRERRSGGRDHRATERRDRERSRHTRRAMEADVKLQSGRERGGDGREETRQRRRRRRALSEGEYTIGANAARPKPSFWIEGRTDSSSPPGRGITRSKSYQVRAPAAQERKALTRPRAKSASDVRTFEEEPEKKDILRKGSTRLKRIRLEDVDMDYHNSEDESEEETERRNSDFTFARSPPNRRGSRRQTGRRKSSPVGIRNNSISQSQQSRELSLRNLSALASDAVASGLTDRPRIPPLKTLYRYADPTPLPQTLLQHNLMLTEHLTSTGLTSFYPPSNPLPNAISSRASNSGGSILRRLSLPPSAISDLTTLALYDLIILCDDSASMARGARWSYLRSVVRDIACISAVFNPIGLRLRFLNARNDSGFNGIVTAEQVETCLDTVELVRGSSRIGTQVMEKAIRPFVVEGKGNKPLIISVVIDGAPRGEDVDTLKEGILATKHWLFSQGAPINAVTFHIVRVGSGKRAKEYLRSLAEDAEVGGLVVVSEKTLGYGMEKAGDEGGMMVWLTRMLAGAVGRV